MFTGVYCSWCLCRNRIHHLGGSPTFWTIA